MIAMLSKEETRSYERGHLCGNRAELLSYLGEHRLSNFSKIQVY